jgi:O-antigen/teichoic acid export membrane protein
MNYTKIAARGTLALLASLIVASLLGYGIRIIIARNFSPAEYGLFYAMHTLITFLIFFRPLGTNIAMIKFIPEMKVRKQFSRIKSLIAVSILIRLIFGAAFFSALFFLAGFLGEFYFRADPFLLRIFSFFLVLSIPYFVMSNILLGFKRIVMFSLVEVSQNFFVLLFLVLFISLGFGIESAVYAYLIMPFLLSALYLTPALKESKWFKNRLVDLRGTFKKTLSFGMPIMVAEFGDKIIGYFDILMLTYFVGLELVGIYNVALPSALALLMLGSAASRVALPIVSELWAKRDKKRLKIGLNIVHRYTFFLLLPAAVLLMVFSEKIIGMFFGSQYAAGALSFSILVIGVVFFAIARINLNMIAGIGRPKTVTRIILVAAAVNVVLNLILIPIYRIEGAAVATAVSYITAFFLSTRSISKYVRSRAPWKEWIKTLVLASTLWVIIDAAMRHIGQLYLVAVAAALAAYCLFAFLLKIIRIKEIKKHINLAL